MVKRKKEEYDWVLICAVASEKDNQKTALRLKKYLIDHPNGHYITEAKKLLSKIEVNTWHLHFVGIENGKAAIYVIHTDKGCALFKHQLNEKIGSVVKGKNYITPYILKDMGEAVKKKGDQRKYTFIEVENIYTKERTKFWGLEKEKN